MPAIRPDDLPVAVTVAPTVAIIVDNGVTVEKATPLQVSDAARPLASEAEAEDGTDNVKVMSPLRVAQATATKAEADFANVLESTFSGKVFATASADGTAGLAQRFSHVINAQDDCGAVGEDVTMNTGALTEAIDKAQALVSSRANLPIGIYLPPGKYKYDGVLPDISSSVVIFSDATRSCQLVPVGNFDALTFRGSGSRCANAGLRNIAMNAVGMTGGYAIVTDWAQDFLLENVLIANPFNAMSLRQAGGTTLRKTVIDRVRNSGFYSFANNTTRNGENDQIDLIRFSDSVITSSYVAGVGSSTVALATFDGRIHTIDVAGLRLLNGGKGFVTANTAGLATQFVPRFLTGYGLEIENMYSTCMDLPFARDFWMSGLFAVGSQTDNGIKLGSGVRGFKLFGANIDSNSLCGIENVGADDVLLMGIKAYNNSRTGSAVKSQIYLGAGSGSFAMYGGLAGKDQTILPAYTEWGKYGIELDAAYTGLARGDGIDVRGNVSGTIFNGGGVAQGSRFTGCRGFNPAGIGLQAVGASPYVYTAGLTQEAITLYNGTGVVATVGGVVVSTTSPASFVLQPRQSVSIAYATAPTMSVNKE